MLTVTGMGGGIMGRQPQLLEDSTEVNLRQALPSSSCPAAPQAPIPHLVRTPMTTESQERNVLLHIAPEKGCNTREDPLCLYSPHLTVPSPSLHHIPFLPSKSVIYRVKGNPFIPLKLMCPLLSVHSANILFSARTLHV